MNEYYDILLVLAALAVVLLIVRRVCGFKNRVTKNIRDKVLSKDPFYESRPYKELTVRDLTCIIAPIMAALIYIVLRLSGNLDNPFS